MMFAKIDTVIYSKIYIENIWLQRKGNAKIYILQVWKKKKSDKIHQKIRKYILPNGYRK